MPEPTATELGKEAEQEAAVFAQAINVQKLLDMLRSFDPTMDNLADNEEIQVFRLSPLLWDSYDLALVGVVSIKHGPSTKNCEANRQI